VVVVKGRWDKKKNYKVKSYEAENKIGQNEEKILNL